jgi:hypothetical protein
VKREVLDIRSLRDLGAGRNTKGTKRRKEAMRQLDDRERKREK